MADAGKTPEKQLADMGKLYSACTSLNFLSSDIRRRCERLGAASGSLYVVHGDDVKKKETKLDQIKDDLNWFIDAPSIPEGAFDRASYLQTTDCSNELYRQFQEVTLCNGEDIHPFCTPYHKGHRSGIYYFLKYTSQVTRWSQAIACLNKPATDFRHSSTGNSLYLDPPVHVHARAAV